MEKLIQKAADIILDSNLTLALTGAGISVESGIPDFRSAGGLWSIYDPAEYATIDAFHRDPDKVWNMLREMNALVENAKPNQAHTGLGELEAMGLLQYIITQNVDNLHQEGGSRNVIEYHGNSSTLSCLWCGARYSSAEKRAERTPRCSCGKTLKPDVIFFGEEIPAAAMNLSFQLASSADVLLIVGTSATVSPANTIPLMVKKRGGRLIEINKEKTYLTGHLTDVFLEGSAGETIPSLLTRVRDLKKGEAH